MVGLLLKAGAKTNILDSVHDDHYVHVGIIILLQKLIIDLKIFTEQKFHQLYIRCIMEMFGGINSCQCSKGHSPCLLCNHYIGQKIRGIKFRQREHVAKCSPSEDFQLYSIIKGL